MTDTHNKNILSIYKLYNSQYLRILKIFLGIFVIIVFRILKIYMIIIIYYLLLYYYYIIYYYIIIFIYLY